MGSVLFMIGAVQLGLYGQSAGRSELRFEVASVRQNRASRCAGRWDFRASRGNVTAENAPLLRIVSRAYNLTDDRVSGPAWMESECYDIRAKAAAGNVADRDLMPMLQELLKERLHLSAHMESEERPVFVLLPGEGGVKMRPDGEAVSVPPPGNDGRILFMAKTLQDLCERLGKVTGRPVIDNTGLHGRFVIVLTYLPFVSTSSDPSDSAADVFSAVKEQLGLRLEARRGQVGILKIDGINKVPAEN
jgi:uncharacterized protein (TIGR03435 family)